MTTMTLYAIAEECRHALSAVESADLTDLSEEERRQLIEDSLGGLREAFSRKALAVGAFVANLNFEIDNLRAMEKRIQERRKAAEAKAEWLAECLRAAMEALGFKEIKDAQIRLRIKRNPPRVIVDDESQVPEDYKERQVLVAVRKSLIGEALKSGLDVPGAHLDASGTRLEIR